MPRAGSSAWRRISSPGSAACPCRTSPRRIENRGAHEAAHTLRQTAGQVFRYGIATGRCERNPAPDLHGALKPIVVKHLAAVLDPSGATALMRAIAAYEGQPLNRAALELSALLFRRPGNIRQLEWAEVDLDGNTGCRSGVRSPARRARSAQAPVEESSRHAEPLRRLGHVAAAVLQGALDQIEVGLAQSLLRGSGWRRLWRVRSFGRVTRGRCVCADRGRWRCTFRVARTVGHQPATTIRREHLGPLLRVAMQPQAAGPGLEDRRTDDARRYLPLLEEALPRQLDPSVVRLEERGVRQVVHVDRGAARSRWSLSAVRAPMASI